MTEDVILFFPGCVVTTLEDDDRGNHRKLIVDPQGKHEPRILSVSPSGSIAVAIESCNWSQPKLEKE